MGLSDYILYRVAKNWPSPMERFTKEFDAEPGTDAYNMAYAQRQFDRKVRFGMQRSVLGLEVLEIGTGRGGIACYIAAIGARRVVGIDLNRTILGFARRFAVQFAARFGEGYHLPVEFLEMSANQLSFADDQFDLVMAENAFEHFTEPEIVMREAFRVLRPGGRLLVPIFSSILSKYGLHLKHGLKLPWANLIFSERSIIRTMHRLAKVNPKLYELYPGLNNNPQRVRDLRPHGDLNDMTYRRFKTLAALVGFEIESFTPQGTQTARMFVSRVPLLRNSILADVLSTGASAVLHKPDTATTHSATNNKNAK
jgi:ubiquinone/menaquinone biosynthesis C-methylase UbiE